MLKQGEPEKTKNKCRGQTGARGVNITETRQGLKRENEGAVGKSVDNDVYTLREGLRDLSWTSTHIHADRNLNIPASARCACMTC